MESEEDDIKLSEHALKALQEFYFEQQKHNFPTKNVVEENWELSQFWYDENTAEILSKSAVKAAGSDGSIACISCPTVYTFLQKQNSNNSIYLFEYDRRFQELYPDNFIYYDYCNPLEVGETFKSYFDVVLVDPPYLSQECLEKVFQTVKYISKSKVILCTGAVMQDYIQKFLNFKICEFKPQHKRKLGNEFKCFANFDFDTFMKGIIS